MLVVKIDTDLIVAEGLEEAITAYRRMHFAEILKEELHWPENEAANGRLADLLEDEVNDFKNTIKINSIDVLDESYTLKEAEKLCVDYKIQAQARLRKSGSIS